MQYIIQKNAILKIINIKILQLKFIVISYTYSNRISVIV